MDIPMKTSKRWTNKDLQQVRRQERAQAASEAAAPEQAQPEREHQGTDVPRKHRRPGSSAGAERGGDGQRER